MPRVTLLIMVLVMAACAAPSQVDDTSAPETEGTDPAVTTTTSPWSSPVDVELVGICGSARFPVADDPALPSTPLTDEEKVLLAAAGEAVSEEWQYMVDTDWYVSNRSDTTVALFGVRVDWSPYYAYASLEVLGDGAWKLRGWGDCRTEVQVDGFNAASWVFDPDVPPDQTSSRVSVWVKEKACASGQAPEGRDIFPVVHTDEETVRVVVLIEPKNTEAETCPGNPWHPVVLDLGEPVGDRVLVDASVMPPLVRTWPPSEESLGDPRDE